MFVIPGTGLQHTECMAQAIGVHRAGGGLVVVLLKVAPGEVV